MLNYLSGLEKEIKNEYDQKGFGGCFGAGLPTKCIQTKNAPPGETPRNALIVKVGLAGIEPATI